MVTSADIHFCPQFGLNVHGKQLYVLIRSASDVSLVTDRNVHDALVRRVAAAWTAWSSGRTDAANAVGATLDGTAIPLAGDGSFDVTVPTTTGTATLALATAAGETTVRPVP